MKTIEVKKGQILQYAGDQNSKIYEVISGLLRSYTIDQKGKEHIFMFAPEAWVIADAVPKEVLCEFFIEALEDSTIVIRDKDLNQARSNMEAIAKRMLVLQRRVIMLMSYSGLQRYEHFIQTLL